MPRDLGIVDWKSRAVHEKIVDLLVYKNPLSLLHRICSLPDSGLELI